MADLGSPQDVLQAMNRLWFDQNILKTIPIFVSEALPPSSPSAAPAVEDSSKSDMASTAISTPHSEEQERSPTSASPIIIENHFQLQPSGSTTSFCNSPPHSSKLRRRRLQKMRCCKSFSELEHEELKGFRDLGFIFNKEVNPHIKSMLPGLQMLGEKQVLTRPYLSEAWLIDRPDSPLPNFRIPPISASSKTDMKKHLRFWARTVAYMINQES